MGAISENKVTVDAAEPEKEQLPLDADFSTVMRTPESFAKLSKLILRDLNKPRRDGVYYLYSKEQIARFLKNPVKNQRSLRDAAIYIYCASSHFRRLIQYFVGLSDLSYVVSPYRIDTSTAKPKTVGRQYMKTLNLLSSMDIKNQFPKILTVCLREDVFYGTMWVTKDSVTIQQLPSNFCDIAVIEGNVLNVSFDFTYFDIHPDYLEYYPEEFRRKYELFQNNVTMRYQELDAPWSFAVKCTNDILNYAIPPFIGIFREIFDLDDYKDLKLTKTELENYAMLVMRLGVNEDGQWTMDYNKAVDFYRNLDNVLPEQVGSVLSPMDIEKITFDHTDKTGDADAIAVAEQNLFSAAGVSSLLFNNVKASANALLLSIKADQSLTYGIVKSIEGVVNRFIQHYPYGKNFKVTFLDVSPYNRKEMGDQYLKACSYGIPMISYYAASQGMMQCDIDGMNFLESEVLNFDERFKPLRNSATLSSGEVGAPEKDIGELTDAGEISREAD